jgi:hypothetical protein
MPLLARSIAVSLATLAGSQLCHANFISDTVFNDSDWFVHESYFYTPGSSSVASQAVGSGFTGNARVVQNMISPGGGIYSINIYSAYTWNASAAITDLTMSIEARSVSSLQAFGFAIEQGGKYWLGGYQLTTPSYAVYTLSLTAADFVPPFGIDPASQPVAPDFSGAGAPIRFGFYTGNSSTGTPYSTIASYSDFTVSFVPAPSAAGALALAALGARRRR